MTSKSHRRALWLLVLPLTFAAQTASTAADDGQQAEANDAVTPAAEVQAANTGERAAVDIRAFVQARAAERVEAAQAGDAEALSALLVADDDLVKGIVKEIPIGHQTRLEEIAFACAFLCSPRSAPITGNTIHLDGGHKMLS